VVRILIHDKGLAAYNLVPKRVEQHERIFLLELFFSAKIEESNGTFGVLNKIADGLWGLTRQDLEFGCQLLFVRKESGGTDLE
jgi:hypothetical protein